MILLPSFLAGIAALAYLRGGADRFNVAGTVLCPGCCERVRGVRGTTVLCNACREPVLIP
ncbi:MAG: hypothetical protein WD066_18555 [Planctomycetaceae bacterium]